MTLRARLQPKSMEGQMIGVLALALLLLLVVLTILELRGHRQAIEAAESDGTLHRLRTMYPLLERLGAEQVDRVLDITSSCHAGYTVTAQPFESSGPTPETSRLRQRIARELALDAQSVRVGDARLTRSDFSYSKCRDSEIDLPMEGIVISLRLGSGKWFNSEVHPHEWHFREKFGWLARAGVAFLFVGGIAIFFMRRLNRPLNKLTTAAQGFGAGLKISHLQEEGPDDLRQAIRSFNMMQQQVADEVARRTNTLAAISHDVRTPLTALRVKVELIEDADVRSDLIASIDRMEELTASALEFLRGQSRSEPMRNVDLGALLESECLDFEEMGKNAAFVGRHGVYHACRPDALARAVRNLIDNAIKYGNGARVELRTTPGHVDISVSDTGPGIPADKVALALEPFERLSQARESNRGGFGLGLAVAKAIAEGHDGKLILSANQPSGLIATIRLQALTL